MLSLATLLAHILHPFVVLQVRAVGFANGYETPNDKRDGEWDSLYKSLSILPNSRHVAVKATFSKIGASQFAEDVIITNLFTNLLKGVDIDDAYATGSSLMPQKKSSHCRTLVALSIQGVPSRVENTGTCFNLTDSGHLRSITLRLRCVNLEYILTVTWSTVTLFRVSSDGLCRIPSG